MGTAALLVGAALTAGRATATPIPFSTDYSHGVELVSASLPTLNSARCPGSWALVRLRFRVDGPPMPTQITLTKEGWGSWSTTAPLGGNADEADLLLPPQIFSSFLMGNPSMTDAHSMQFHFEVLRPEGSTSGIIEIDTHPVTTRPVQTDGPAYVYVGSNDAGWPFQSMAEDDFIRLAKYRDCLSEVRAIVLPEDRRRVKWSDQPGLAAWIEAGGVLILPQQGPEQWTLRGGGLVVRIPGNVTKELVDRAVLTTRREAAQWGMDNVPRQEVWPGFRAPILAILLALAIYIVALIPANYVFLRRRYSKEWFWVSSSVVSLVFCVVVAAICYGFKGVTPSAGRVTLVNELSPGVYTALGHLSIFSPQTRRFNVRLPAEAMPQLLHEDRFYDDGFGPVAKDQSASVSEGEQPELRGFPVLQWCSNTVSYYFSPKIIGSITGTAKYSRSGGWTAEVQNHSSLNLEDCRVWAAGHWQRMPDLPEGGAANTIVATDPALNRPIRAGGAGSPPPGWPFPAGDRARTGGTDFDSAEGATQATTFRERIRKQEWENVGLTLNPDDIGSRRGIYFVG